jgi:hypothetical protein
MPIFDEPGRGRKQCRGCRKYVGVRSRVCENCQQAFGGASAEPAEKPATLEVKRPKEKPRLEVPERPRRNLSLVLTPGQGLWEKGPFCPVKIPGKWAHTEDEIREWIDSLMTIGVAKGKLYLPQAIMCFACDRQVTPKGTPEEWAAFRQVVFEYTPQVLAAFGVAIDR